MSDRPYHFLLARVTVLDGGGFLIDFPPDVHDSPTICDEYAFYGASSFEDMVKILRSEVDEYLDRLCAVIAAEMGLQEELADAGLVQPNQSWSGLTDEHREAFRKLQDRLDFANKAQPEPPTIRTAGGAFSYNPPKKDE